MKANCSFLLKRMRKCIGTLLRPGLAALLLFLIISCRSSFAKADAEGRFWEAGCAVTNITPGAGLWMAGYGARTKPAEGKEIDLRLKALALKDERGQRGLIITSDLIGFPRQIASNILANLQQAYGLKPDQVILSASHTHCGPVLRASAMDIYGLDDKQRRKLDEYASRLEAAATALAGKALEELSPARLVATQGITRFAVNRRNNLEQEVPQLLAGGKVQGPMDHSVPVLSVYGTNGRLKTVLFGYACHNTVMSYHKWSGDYAGFAQLAIEKHHPGATAMFFMGCGGDQNPVPRRDLELAQRYGAMLASAVEEVFLLPEVPLEPLLATSMRVIALPFGEQPGKPELEKLISARETPEATRRWAASLLKLMDSGRRLPRSYPYPMQAWNLGGRQLLLTMGGEPVVDYSLRLKAQFGTEIWVAGYCNDVMGYIPSRRVLEEDSAQKPRPGWGYEGARSMITYGLPAWRWDEEIEELIAKAAVDLVQEVRRE
jgi:hypothetical protein